VRSCSSFGCSRAFLLDVSRFVFSRCHHQPPVCSALAKVEIAVSPYETDMPWHMAVWCHSELSALKTGGLDRRHEEDSGATVWQHWLFGSSFLNGGSQCGTMYSSCTSHSLCV
jgi:hypothetical protein